MLTFDRPGPNILGNILQLLAFVKHKDKRLAIEVADRACGRLDECSGPLLVAILKAAVDLQMEHRIIWVRCVFELEQCSSQKLEGWSIQFHPI